MKYLLKFQSKIKRNSACLALPGRAASIVHPRVRATVLNSLTTFVCKLLTN